eukprot:1675295-Amphidinium_carterae.1
MKVVAVRLRFVVTVEGGAVGTHYFKHCERICSEDSMCTTESKTLLKKHVMTCDAALKASMASLSGALLRSSSTATADAARCNSSQSATPNQPCSVNRRLNSGDKGTAMMSSAWRGSTSASQLSF